MQECKYRLFAILITLPAISLLAGNFFLYLMLHFPVWYNSMLADINAFKTFD
jgi:hypothetical protein